MFSSTSLKQWTWANNWILQWLFYSCQMRICFPSPAFYRVLSPFYFPDIYGINFTEFDSRGGLQAPLQCKRWTSLYSACFFQNDLKGWQTAFSACQKGSGREAEMGTDAEGFSRYQLMTTLFPFALSLPGLGTWSWPFTTMPTSVGRKWR